MFTRLQGKEFETRLKEKKPGDLSDELRIALGMPIGPVRGTLFIYNLKKENKAVVVLLTTSVLSQNAHKVPPPWLIAMQRYGPPPSYPNLKIPGLNSPIPDVSWNNPELYTLN